MDTKTGSRKALFTLLGSSAIIFSLAACTAAADDDSSASESALADLCGNGTRDPGEQCDDGNKANLDGCSATCSFEQTHRLNSIEMLFATDTFCTSNAIGAAVKSVAQGQIKDGLSGAVADGSVSILLGANGLADLTGAGAQSFTLSSFIGAPTTSSLGLDSAYTANALTVTPDGKPLVSLAAQTNGTAMTAGPGDLAFSMNIAGSQADLSLSGTRAKATLGPATAPAGHGANENLDPALKTFATTTGGELCGNISAASLAAIKVPSALTSGSTSCSQGYNSSNSMLDVFVGGCRVFIVSALGATQPDKANPSAPVVGAGAPYKLVAGSGNKVTGCKDKSGASVNLAACLQASAFSAAFKFTSQRVTVRGTSTDD